MPHQVEPRQCLVLVKANERYVFTYDNDEQSREQLLQALGQMASDTELTFSWYDAAVISQRIRKTVEH